MTVGHSEAEPFWVEFLRSLARRGLRGTKLVISDAHEGLKAAITKILSATWQRCRVHFMRNALAYAGKTQRRIVSAWVGTAFAQDDVAAARKQWRDVADQARPKVPKLAALMDKAEADVLAYMNFPAQHRTKIHSTNPIERIHPARTVGDIEHDVTLDQLFLAILVRAALRRLAMRPRAILSGSSSISFGSQPSRYSATSAWSGCSASARAPSIL